MVVPLIIFPCKYLIVQQENVRLIFRCGVYTNLFIHIAGASYIQVRKQGLRPLRDNHKRYVNCFMAQSEEKNEAAAPAEAMFFQEAIFYVFNLGTLENLL